MTIDCRDCGTCERCQQTDDYGPAWRNPEFRSPGDAEPDVPPASHDGGGSDAH